MLTALPDRRLDRDREGRSQKAKERKMTRKSSTLILSLIVLAVALAPTGAFADGYESVNAITGPGQAADDRYSSVTALVGDSGRDAVAADRTPVDSLNAIVGADGVPEPSPQLVSSTDDDGLNWTDVGIGALIAGGLILMTLAGAVLVARHRRPTAESRA
jgi:hypothetical protein